MGILPIAGRTVDGAAGAVHFRGYYLSEAALIAAVPTGNVGDYAVVRVVGGPDDRYIWDEDGAAWVKNAIVGGALTEDNLWYGDAGDMAVEKKLRLSKYSDLFVAFEPTFSVEAIGGDFPGADTVEKGYTIPAADLAWANQAGGDFPIDNSDQYALDGTGISLDSLNVLTGGEYNTPFDETDHGSGFSARLHSGSEQVTKTDTFRWLWRMFWFADAAASLTPSEVADIVAKVAAVDNDALRTGRTGTFNFDASGGKYLWFIWPQAFGAASEFVFAGLPTTFNQYAELAVANQYGASADYYLYRSLNIQTGADLDIEVS